MGIIMQEITPRIVLPHPTGAYEGPVLLNMALAYRGDAAAMEDRKRAFPANTDATYFGYAAAKY